MRHAVALALIAAACGGDDTSGGDSCVFGDPDAPAQLEILHLDADGQIVSTATDDVIPLRIAPTGAWTVLLGARVTNIDGCEMTITTSFRDVCSPETLRFDMRPAQPHEDQRDGWGRIPPADFAWLQTCPTLDSMRNLHGEPFLFTVSVSDTHGRSASREIRLPPECPPDDPRCLCECDRDWVLREIGEEECTMLNTEPGPSC